MGFWRVTSDLNLDGFINPWHSLVTTYLRWAIIGYSTTTIFTHSDTSCSLLFSTGIYLIKYVTTYLSLLFSTPYVAMGRWVSQLSIVAPSYQIFKRKECKPQSPCGAVGVNKEKKGWVGGWKERCSRIVACLAECHGEGDVSLVTCHSSKKTVLSKCWVLYIYGCASLHPRPVIVSWICFSFIPNFLPLFICQMWAWKIRILINYCSYVDRSDLQDCKNCEVRRFSVALSLEKALHNILYLSHSAISTSSLAKYE
jgi:hypothetical protein